LTWHLPRSNAETAPTHQQLRVGPRSTPRPPGDGRNGRRHRCPPQGLSTSLHLEAQKALTPQALVLRSPPSCLQEPKRNKSQEQVKKSKASPRLGCVPPSIDQSRVTNCFPPAWPGICTDLPFPVPAQPQPRQIRTGRDSAASSITAPPVVRVQSYGVSVSQAAAASNPVSAAKLNRAEQSV
jgi:hypothetical protein